MRRAIAAGIVMVALGCAGCGAGSASAVPNHAAEAPAPPAQDGSPGWIPSYTKEQAALLAPVDTPIQVPAERVFPDLARFRYARDVRLDDVRRSIRFSSLVANVLEKSPRFYTLMDARPELANTAVQYGPPGPSEPDPWEVLRKSSSGERSLARMTLDEAGRASLARGESLRKSGDLRGAAATLREAFDRTHAPPLGLALAETLAQHGDTLAAVDAYRKTIAQEPTLASAHTGLAALLVKGGRRDEARQEIAEALAYHPSSRRALAVADEITGGRASKPSEGRIRPFAIFLDVDAVGAVHIAWSGGEPARFYAGCRAILRYEPEIRASLFDEPPDTPYYLSMVEEMICLEAAIGAYVAQHMAEKSAPDDPAMDALVDLAREDGLAGYAMTEILGRHRPERARTAPPDVHRAMVRYVERVILGGKAFEDDPASGVYTASR
jgi:tetratricopeptide (TPR) repeat protein